MIVTWLKEPRGTKYFMFDLGENKKFALLREYGDDGEVISQTWVGNMEFNEWLEIEEIATSLAKNVD